MSKIVRPVFLYDTLMSMDVLARLDVRPDSYEIAALDAWRLVCDPWPRLEPKEVGTTYGILVSLSVKEIERAANGPEWKDKDYFPEPVIVRVNRNLLSPALAFTPNPPTVASAPGINTLKEIVRHARSHGFPDWYIHELESLSV